MNFIKWLPILIVVGCQAQEPTGQVIASFPGSDVTFKEFEYEKKVSNKLSEREILDALIDRKVLVKTALDFEIDLNDEFHFALRRAREELLIEHLKKEIAKKSKTPLDNEVWISINQQPWRYKNRLRLYLTRNSENGERTVFWIDTAEYDSELPEEVYNAQPGSVLTLDGQDWNVHLREALVASPSTMFKTGINRFEESFVSSEIQQLIEAYRQSGQIVYQEGYGPAYSTEP